MTILSNRQIVARLGDTVIIEPFDLANVNTSSYDVTLGEWYYIEHRPSWWQRLFRKPIYNIWDLDHIIRVWGEPQIARKACNIRGHWKWRGISPTDRVILIPPKSTILAHTREFIGGRESVKIEALSPSSTTMMKARSSYGRNFIEVCKCAGYGDVGYTNRWTMEITNNSSYYRLPLVVGRRIAQIVFMETGPVEGANYASGGKYQNITDVQKLINNWHPGMMLPRLDLDRDVKQAA